jgi:hypothetical protein
MPTVQHPRTLDAVDGHPPARVTVGGSTYAVNDGTVDLPDDTAVRELARAYDLSPGDIRTGGTCDVVKSDGDVCGRERPCPYHDE